jgi:hypothetical protein
MSYQGGYWIGLRAPLRLRLSNRARGNPRLNRCLSPCCNRPMLLEDDSWERVATLGVTLGARTSERSPAILAAWPPALSAAAPTSAPTP